MTTYVYDIEVFPNFFSATFVGHSGTEVFYEWADGAWGDYESDNQELLTFLEKDNYYIGYNSQEYDDQMISYWRDISDLEVFDRLEAMYKRSGEIISRKYKRKNLGWKSLDLAKVIQKGKAKKSLKEVAISLRWHRIQDLPLPFDEHIPKSSISTILDYNKNDVLITHCLYKAIKSDINLRLKISRKYDVDVLSASASAMSSRLLDKLYANAIGSWKFRYDRTNRSTMSMKSIIIGGFEFETPKLQKWLNKIREGSVSIEDEWVEKVLIGNTGYNMKKGGLHSIHEQPEIYEADDVHEIVDIDAVSYYPKNMINLSIKPRHLSLQFIVLLDQLTEQRVEAKRDSNNLDLSAEVRAQAKVEAETLKVTVNSIFGKLNYENYWLYDPLALYRVTINGQLFLLRLIESLTFAGFNVFYANTDGITVRGRRDRRSELDAILGSWELRYNFKLETNSYRKFILRDVNNYLVINEDGTTKAKGDFNKDNLTTPSVMVGLMKKFEYPVVSLAIHEYFVNGISTTTTISNHRDALDFCISQKVGKMFSAVTFDRIVGGHIDSSPQQRTNRYLVSKPRYGGSLYKWKGTRRHQIVAAQHILLMNDINEMENARDKVQESWYVNEAEKIIGLFKTKQLRLF